MRNRIDKPYTVVRMADIARIRNTQQKRDETRRQQFALVFQEEATHKETQAQNAHKSESPEIHRKTENKKKRRRHRKRSHKRSSGEQQSSDDKQHHIDFKF